MSGPIVLTGPEFNEKYDNSYGRALRGIFSSIIAV